MKRKKRGAQGIAEFRQLVIDPGRNAWEECSRDEAVCFKPLQRERKHPLRYAADPSLNFVVAQLSFRKRTDDHDGPLIPDARQHIGKPFAIGSG